MKKMKRNITAFILAGTIILSICGCGNEKSDKNNNAVDMETEILQENTTSQEYIQSDDKTFVDQEETVVFAEFENLQFCFSSGAGGWATLMTIEEDGSFSGEFFDGELGITGEGYPNGTMYQCNFSGQFTYPIKVNEYTYSMQISELNYAEEVGKEEIKDGVLYCYSEVYGLTEAKNVLIYLPGAPLAELPEEFRSWVGYYDLSEAVDTELSFYALYDEGSQSGFSSYNIVEDLKELIASTEVWAAPLENSIKNDPLTQMEYNEKSGQLYELWDYALNRVWDILKQTVDEKEMNALTAKQLEWIAMKETAVAEAGAEFEGGSMQPMVMNQMAAELTKDRVYELMKLFE